MSRKNKPKQLYNLISEHSMLQDTVHRMEKDFPTEKIFINTNIKYKKEVLSQFPKFPPENIIYEPMSRNTSGAIAFSSAFAYYRDPEAVVAFIHSDHLIRKEKKFNTILQEAGKVAAREQKIVLLGIKPTYPATDLGYINIHNQPLSNNQKDHSTYKIKNFVEKPDLITAKKYYRDWSYLWNAGMFIAPVKVMIESFKKHLPDDYKIIHQLIKAFGADNGQELINELQPQLTKIAIDYSIMEKEKNLLVIPADIGWNDIGIWSVLKDVLSEEEEDNVTKGEVLAVDTKNSLIYGHKKPIAVLGVEDLIVVDTEDIMMICNKNRTADVKKIIDRLKEFNRDQYL